MMADGSVPWMSVKKTLTATSTVKVEFISCFEATSHGVCLENFIYGSSFFHPNCRIKQDQGDLINDSRGEKRRIIKMRLNWKKQIDSKFLDWVWVPSLHIGLLLEW